MSQHLQEKMLIEQRVANDAKSVLVAYLLLIFLGWFGIHRFYLGQTGTAVTILLLSLAGFATLWIGVGLVPLAIVGLWCLIDLFLIPGMVASDRERLRQRLFSDMQMMPAAPAA